MGKKLLKYKFRVKAAFALKGDLKVLLG